MSERGPHEKSFMLLYRFMMSFEALIYPQSRPQCMTSKLACKFYFWFPFPLNHEENDDHFPILKPSSDISFPSSRLILDSRSNHMSAGFEKRVSASGKKWRQNQIQILSFACKWYPFADQHFHRKQWPEWVGIRWEVIIKLQWSLWPWGSMDSSCCYKSSCPYVSSSRMRPATRARPSLQGERCAPSFTWYRMLHQLFVFTCSHWVKYHRKCQNTDRSKR
jgi:hypothetical protein